MASNFSCILYLRSCVSVDKVMKYLPKGKPVKVFKTEYVQFCIINIYQ